MGQNTPSGFPPQNQALTGCGGTLNAVLTGCRMLQISHDL
jgi:hypothetical protein